jgi:hypothetical protein
VQILSSLPSDAIIQFGIAQINQYSNLLIENLQKKRQRDLLEKITIRIMPVPKTIEDLLVEKKKIREKWQQYTTSKIQDAYYIIGHKDEIYIYGYSSRAILFGCYSLLQELGIKWFFPGKRFEYIPNEILLDLSAIRIIEIPTFTKREIVVQGTINEIVDWIDYAAKMRMTGIGIRTATHLEKINAELSKRGLDLSVKMRILGDNFCTSSEASFLKSEENLTKFLNQIPLKSNIIHAWPSNRFINRCSCPQDRKVHSSDILLRRLNFLINNPLLGKTLQLTYFAHLGTWRTPQYNHPHPRIHLELAPVHRCFNHSIDNFMCKINKQYVKPETESLIRWFSPANTEIMEYWLDSSLFGRQEFEKFGWAKHPGQGRIPHIPKIMQKDLRYYHSLGVKQISCFVTGVDRTYLNTFCSPMIYLYPQLLWNPEIDLKPIMKSFCSTYFGIDREIILFDESEILDPKDITSTDFYRYIDLVRQRISWLKDHYQKLKPGRIKTRVKAFIEENERKVEWTKGFWQARIVSWFYILWFKVQRKRC